MTQDEQTTEQKLADVRKTMRYYRPAQTFGREHGRIGGWYYTEPVAPCREYDVKEIHKSLEGIFGV